MSYAKFLFCRYCQTNGHSEDYCPDRPDRFKRVSAHEPGAINPSKGAPWTRHVWNSFVTWHESVIAQYPALVQKELRDARTKFLAGVRIAP